MSKESSTPEQEPKILSFEEFSHRDPNPHYRNFFLYFASGIGGGTNRLKEHYRQFSDDYRDLAKSLCNKIQTRDCDGDVSESLRPFDKELYEAYKIMRGYGVSDDELFT